MAALPRHGSGRLPRSRRTLEAAKVSRLEDAVNVDQREHDQRSEQRAQLLHCTIPHEGAVTVAAQDHPHHHLDVAECPCEEDPGDDLWAQKGGEPLGGMTFLAKG